MDDPNQVAAATLAMPPFVMLTGIANLFGIGGASLISRSLGEGNREKARRCAAFSIYTAAAVAFVYGFSMYLFRPIIFPLLGADAATYDFCSDYVLWTIAIGGIPTVMNACLAHLVRAEGYSKEASIGVALGGILNIILDPILIFPMQLGVKGAAIATMLSNLIATCYFLVLLYKNSDHTVIKFSPRNYTLRDGIPKEILLVGFPSFLMMLMGTFSNIVLNKMVVSYSNQAIAGMGIAKKIDMLAFAIANGMTQGVLPLIGYNFGARNKARVKEVNRFAFRILLIIAVALVVFCEIFSDGIIRAFVNDAATISVGRGIMRCYMLCTPFMSIVLLISTLLTSPTLLQCTKRISPLKLAISYCRYLPIRN